jgi:hypothetical protein
MTSMLETIAPRSDQLNGDDLVGRDLTVTITGVDIRAGDQPVSVHFDGDSGKPYKPCLSMRRVMVHVWGDDANNYIGKSMTLCRDPGVKFGALEVGGIRIRNMSHIQKATTMALTVTKGSKKAYTVHPLAGTTQKTAPKKPSLSEWLTETGSRLTYAPAAADVEAIVAEEMVQKALVSLKNGSLALLTEQIAKARERTKVATEDGDASFLGGQEPVENDPALAQQDDDTFHGDGRSQAA